jgi:hypothetical protein
MRLWWARLLVGDQVKFANHTTVAVLMAFVTWEYVIIQKSAATYQNHCAICHRSRREGVSPSFPALLGIGQRLFSEEGSGDDPLRKKQNAWVPEIVG